MDCRAGCSLGCPTVASPASLAGGLVAIVFGRSLAVLGITTLGITTLGITTRRRGFAPSWLVGVNPVVLGFEVIFSRVPLAHWLT
jgi:hypothetical protein